MSPSVAEAVSLRPNLWRDAAVAAVAGAVAVLSFAPFYAWPLALISLAVLFTLWCRAASPRAAALIGFCWGMGLFLVGVPWLFVSLHTYGDMPAALAAVAIVLFCAYLSVYPALAGYVQARLKGAGRWQLLALMPACFVAAEVLRGWMVTGFPWLIVGYSQTPSATAVVPLAGYAPVIGVFGISLLLAMSAGAIVLASARLSGTPPTARLRQQLAVAAVAVWAGGVLLGGYEWSQPSGNALSVSLLQGNVAQNMKWREDQQAATLENYLGLIERSRGKLIVLPETALPFMLQALPTNWALEVAEKARENGGDVLLGIAYRGTAATEGGRSELQYFNGALAFGSAPPQQYAKRHLVAFGEFIPPLFSWVYQWLRIPMGAFTPGQDVQAPMRLSGHAVGVNICYEDAFGAEIARQLPQAELLVNLTNMAWFGPYLAADQHAQFSQMRALETSRWMLRATNTGVTAAINEKGRIVAALPQFTRDVLEVDVLPRTGTTLYVRWRDWPVWLYLAGVLVFSGFAARRSVKLASI